MSPGARRTLFALSVLCLAWAPTLQAQTISSNAEAVEAGVLSVDPQGPATSGQVESALSVAGAFTVDFLREGYARAVQRVDGIGSVGAHGLFANGQVDNRLTASTYWSDSATNTTGGPVTYEFQYLIAPAALRIGDFAGLSSTSLFRPEVRYALEIRANGVVVFSSAAEMAGGFVGHSFTETGTSLVPSFVDDGSIFGYDFEARLDVLNLGSFGPGETVTVEYTMLAEVVTPGYEAGGLARVGDPFDLDGTPGFTGTFFGNGVVATDDASMGEIKSRFE
jgi:hypothetical protein